MARVTGQGTCSYPHEEGKRSLDIGIGAHIEQDVDGQVKEGQSAGWSDAMIEIRFRRVEIRGIGTFDIPTNISRVDHKTTHGWFVRFWTKGLSMTKLFSDNPLGGPQESFALRARTQTCIDRCLKHRRSRTKEGACDSSRPTEGGQKTPLSTSSIWNQACRGTKADLCRNEKHRLSGASGGCVAEGLADP